jgi:hypothetical protein
MSLLPSKLKHGRSWSYLLRTMVILGSWQGPIPWCHSHESWAATSAAQRQWLNAHLCTHHAEACRAGECLGWHLHVDFPCSSDRTPEEQPKQEQDRLATATSSGEWLSELSAVQRSLQWPIGGALLIQSIAPLEQDRSGAILPRHFWETFSPVLALPVRLGVQRC